MVDTVAIENRRKEVELSEFEMQMLNMLEEEDAGDDDDYYDEVEDDDEYFDEYSTETKGQKKKKRSKTVAKKEKRDEKKEDTLPDWCFEMQEDCIMNVNCGAHDIHYKEQLWGIPSRTVEYHLQLVRLSGLAKNIAREIELSAEDVEKAASGEERWFRLVTFAEAIPASGRILAYVRVRVVMKEGTNGKKLGYTVYMKRRAINEVHGNYRDVEKGLKSRMKRILSEAKKKM